MIIQQSLGTLPPASSLIATGITTGATISAATGATAGLLAAIGIGAQAVPIVGTIVGGIALVIGALGIGNGCGASCTNSTAVVNKVEPYLQQNLTAAQQQAQANGGCLQSAEVTTLVGNFNTLWQYVVTGCGQVGGPGGSQCVADRQSGGKIDWFKMYLAPINAFPVCAVTPASVVNQAGSEASNLFSSLGISNNMLLIGAVGLAGIALVTMSEKH